MAAHSELPNFAVIASSHADLARELGRCANLPLLQGGSLIIQEIREMRSEMREFREEVRAEIRQVKSLIVIRYAMKQQPQKPS